MGWLLELLFEAVRELCSQFIIDMMDIASGMFTEILSCDLDLFEELFGVVGTLYQNAVLPIAVALLLMILTWQVFKSMFGKLGINSEDPLELVFRSGFCLFMLVYARDIVNYVLEVAGTPYQWVVGTGITVDSFSGYVSAAEAAVSVLGTDALSISLLLLIMHFVVAWNYFKLLFILAERYVLLGVISYTAPLAFATGGSRATNNILASWTKMFGGQVMIVILDAWCLKMFLAGYGNLMASGYGFTRFFAATMCLIGFCKIAGKLDSYMASLGVSMGRTMGGLSGLGALMMAGRLLSGGGRGRGASTAASGSGHMNFGNGRPIPMGGAGVSASAGAMSGMDGNIKDGAGFGIGGMDAGNMADGFQGMESQNPDMGDGFSVFQMDDSALAGQNLPFGTPDDENGFAQGADDGMPDVSTVPEEDGALPSMESDGGIPIGATGMGPFEEEPLSAGDMAEGGELPSMEEMESGSQILPFGNVEDMAGGMETGESGSIFGQETMSGATGLEQSGESTGIGDLQDRMDSRTGNQTEGVAMGDGADGSGIPSYGGTQESSVSGSSTDSFDTGAMEHMDGAGAVSGMGTVAAESSGSMNGLMAAESGQTLSVGDSSGFAAGGSAVNDGIDTSAAIAGNAAVNAGASAAVAGVSQQSGISEGLRGRYQAERDGKQYMRYDTGLYEKPKGPYQTIHENGKTYYELSKQEKAPAMLPETKAVLEKNGTLRLEKVYQQKERMEKPKEQPALQERPMEQQGEKKAVKKPVKNQTGTRRRNQRRKAPDRK
ncbi:hypothetical protein [Enterocloster clostridioformis]|uniref:hypothetical protein n=1 Tax=Enterocloster clostridioformis TaxID=1531 RepID=UPI00156E3074|nr:hypothetical protein [Enterocloster clostridioformis]NSJ55490.1 hypothetical protein [Enterocloster clostridioformis]